MQSGQQLVLGTVLLELHARHSVHDSIDKEQRHTTLTYTHTHTRTHQAKTPNSNFKTRTHPHTHPPTLQTQKRPRPIHTTSTMAANKLYTASQSAHCNFYTQVHTSAAMPDSAVSYFPAGYQIRTLPEQHSGTVCIPYLTQTPQLYLGENSAPGGE